MVTHVRARRPTTAALIAFVVLMFLPNRPAEGAIDNDVIIDWSNCQPKGPGRCGFIPVFGAPRLVAASTAAELAVVIDFLDQSAVGAMVTIGKLDLIFRTTFTDECLETIPLSRDCPVTFSFDGTSSFDTDKQIRLTADRFKRPVGTSLQDYFKTFGNGTFIVTLNVQLNFPNGKQTLPTMGPFPQNTLTISLTGAGEPVVFNRVGDLAFTAGNAADVPTRSLELVRALNVIEHSLFPRRALDLDSALPAGREFAVGFTHAFDFLPSGVAGALLKRVSGAHLKLHLKTSDPAFSNDFILLDEAVRDLGKPRPLILVLLKGLPNTFAGDDGYDFDIDLFHVPVSVLRPGDSYPSRQGDKDVTGNLQDGQLNVVVVGQSAVDYSDLTITLKERAR